MLHRRLTVLQNVRPIAIGAAGLVALTAIAACGPPRSIAAPPPPPPPPSCAPVTGQSGSVATLSPAVAADMAASAVRDARTDAADEHSIVTLESTPAGPAVTTHPVSSPSEAATVAAQAAVGNDLLAVDTDAPVTASVATNDPSSGSQWAFTNTSFGALWPAAIGTSSPALVVAVIDSGVDGTHPDLSGQVLTGMSLVSGAPTAADDNGHGTHVAGIIAAMTNNSVGVRGAASGVRILPIKALNSSGSGTYSTIATAITIAVSQGAKVINMSLGGTVPSTIFDAAVANANANGVTVVAAAGNNGASGNPASFPGATPGVIAVGAVTSTLDRASFSTCGAYVDLAAPGAGILSTVPGSGYASWGGTSMASPFVAAAAAVIESAHPACTPAAIEAILEAGATDRGSAGRDDLYGAGVVDPQQSLSLTTC
ncbi:MAG: S8 family serine peptidase [Acidimicrobiia bacterium]